MSYVIIDYLGEDIEYLFGGSDNNAADDEYYVPYEEPHIREYGQEEDDVPQDGYSRYTPQEEELRMFDEMTNSEQVEYLRNKRYDMNEPFDTDDYEYLQESYLEDIRGDESDYCQRYIKMSPTIDVVCEI